MKSNNLTYNAYLDDAANAIAADDRDQTRGCIESVIAETSNCAKAWLIKAWTCESLMETEAAIRQCLEIDPSSDIAAAGLRWVHGIQELAELQFEAKRQAAEEARRLAEEARLKAEEESRLRAAEEARLRAAEEARLRAAEEARLRAEEEARLRADEEARLRAEEEARLRAEEEASLRAEEEARLRAEEEASLRAEEAIRQTEQERQNAEAEQKAERQAEQARLELEEQARHQIEEARHWAEEESQFNAELEKQSELVQKVKADVDTQSKRSAPQHHLSPTENVGDGDEIETELKNSVDSLASEVRMEIQSNPVNGSTPTKPGKARIPLVLAVDDSPTVRKLVSLTLASDGFEVITASDGVEALNILAERLPDIILSDITMPKLNGYKLCKFVKKHERTKSIPVVMLSGNEGVFDKMRGKMSGCDDYICKPFESAELIKKVREHLNATSVR